MTLVDQRNEVGLWSTQRASTFSDLWECVVGLAARWGAANQEPLHHAFPPSIVQRHDWMLLTGIAVPYCTMGRLLALRAKMQSDRPVGLASLV